FFFSSRRRHTISKRDWSSDVCSSDLLVRLIFQFGGGHALGPVAQNDHLLQAVGGGHPHPVVPAELVSGALNVHVGGLRLLGVHHIQVPQLLHGPLAALDLVGVKDHDDLTAPPALVVAQPVNELVPCPVQIL